MFGCHPTIAPLVALVAGEYLWPEAVEETGPRDSLDRGRGYSAARIPIYQSRYFEATIPIETTMMVALCSADLTWTDSRGNLEDDLHAMRVRMIRETAPIAMVWHRWHGGR